MPIQMVALTYIVRCKWVPGQEMWADVNEFGLFSLQKTSVKMEEDSDYSDTRSPVSTTMQESNFCTQENTIDSTAEVEQTGELEHTDGHVEAPAWMFFMF